MSLYKPLVRVRHNVVGFYTLATVPANRVWKLMGLSLHNPLQGSTTVAAFFLQTAGGATVDVETADHLTYRQTATILCKWTLAAGDSVGLNIAAGPYADVQLTGIEYGHL